MFTKKIRAKEELVNGRAMGIKIPFSFMPCLRNERERNGFGVLSAPKEITKKEVSHFSTGSRWIISRAESLL